MIRIFKQWPAASLLIALGLFALFVPEMNAQQNVSAAALTGTVEDSSGLPVPGAAVTVTDTQTGQRRLATSDAEGRYRFNYIPPGDHVLHVDKDGFDAAELRFTATVGQAIEIRVPIHARTVSAQVDVNAGEPVVEVSRTQVAETVLPKDVENLPLNGRNFLDLALLLPAVSRTNTGSPQRFAETSAVPGTGISIAGQRNLNNSFIVDGSSANDDSVELAGTYYSQEVIREFQVITNGAGAEFGRASAGFINIITLSGTNEFRGKVYGFLRDDRFDARNALAATGKDPLTQTQYGASAGGPVIKGRTFFFSNFEQTRRHDSAVVTIKPENAAAINERLDAVGYRGPRIRTGLAGSGYDTTNFFARVDHKLNANNDLVVTYNFYDINAVNARSVGGLSAVSRGTDLENSDHTVNTQNVTSLGQRFLNEFRFQFRRSRLAAPATDPTGPAVNINGVASFGTSTTSPTRRDIDLYQVSDSFTAVLGRHVTKAGGEFIQNQLDIGFPGSIKGVYTFNNLAAFQSGTYSQFQQAFGAVEQKQSNPNFGVFAQDEWRPRRDLTISFGLRYDLQFLPDPINTDRDNAAPRFGFAFSPNDKTVLRGSFGIYYDRIPTRATSNALQRDGSKYIVVQFNGPAATGAPVFPNVLAAPPSTLVIKPAITRIDPDIGNSSTQQASLQIERELPFAVSASAGYIYVRGQHLILSRNVNVPACTDITLNLCRPDPNFGNISRYEGSGDSYYNGLIVSVNKRQGRWASARVSYTLSKSIDNSGNFFFSTPQNNFDLRDDRGLSDNDQRHRLTLSGTFNTPPAKGGPFAKKLYGDLQVSWIYTYASRLPFNVLAGNDRNRDTNNNDRPAGIGRNTGRGFDQSSLDLRLSRRFAFSERMNLELLVEAFNVTNRANFSVPNNTFGPGPNPLPDFGRPTVALDPRQMQFGFRFNF